MPQAMSDSVPALMKLFATVGVQRPEDAIGYLLWRVAHRHQREIDRALADLDLTHLQFVALVQSAWLAKTGAVVTQPDLAAYSNIHPMQLSNVLKALEAKGLIARPRNPSDARSKLIAVTAAGIAMLEQAIPRAQSLQGSFFGDPQTAGATLHNALRQIVAGWGDEA